MSLITENSPLLEAPEKNCTYGHGDLEKLEHREENKNAEDKPLLGEDNAEDDSAPDGGWGWLVTLAGFVIWLLNGSCSAVFGVLFSGFLLDLGVSSSTTAWIQNLTFVLSNFCCYLMDPLVEEFGWRRVGLAMGVMNGCGLALSAFANSAHYLFFSYTVMAGIPIDILLTLTFAVVPHYFTTKRTLANSLMTTGSSFSIMVMPVVVTFLLDEYGFKQATLITAALYFNSCVAAMVFHPVEWHAKRPRPCTRRKVEMKTESSTLKRVAVNIKSNLGLLRSARVVIIGLVLGINVMGLFNFYYLVPFAMKAAGHTADEVGMCLMAAGITVLVTRFCQPLIVMWANLTHQTALMMGSTIIATSTVVFAWSDTLIQKMSALGTFGVGHGFFFTSYNLVMVEVLGLPLLQPMLSVTGLFKSSSFLIFGPLIGLVRDLSGSFPVCLTLLGVIGFFSIALWILIPFARRYDLRREQPDE